MKTKLYQFTRDDVDPAIFKKLKEHRLYMRDGVLKQVYLDPVKHSYEGSCLGVIETDHGQPVSVCFAGNHQYFGWEEYIDLNGHYGMIGFYTLPDHRNKGLATSLFEAYDDKFKLRKLCASIRAKNVMKSVNQEDLTMLEYA